jgi:hypothetical protein
VACGPFSDISFGSGRQRRGFGGLPSNDADLGVSCRWFNW